MSGSYAAARLLQKGLSAKQRLRAFYPFFVGIMELVVIHTLFKYTHGEVGNYVDQIEMILFKPYESRFYSHLFEVILYSLVYLGLFLLPMTLLSNFGWMFFIHSGGRLSDAAHREHDSFFGIGPIVLRSSYAYAPSANLLQKPGEILWLSLSAIFFWIHPSTGGVIFHAKKACPGK